MLPGYDQALVRPRPMGDGRATGRQVRPLALRWRRAEQATRRAWRLYRWLVTTVAVVVAFTLGFIGFGQAPITATSPRLTIIDRIYDTLQLFRFGTAVPPPYSLDLQLARWLALITVAYAAAAGLRALFVQQWAETRVRFSARNHIVVCGAGEMGTAVALDFYDRGLPVVVIDRTPLAVGVARCRAAGIPFLTGDATDPLVLLRARLKRARFVVTACGNDDRNVDIAVLALSLAGTGNGRLRRCWAHIDDDRMCQLLESSSLADESAEGRRLEFFNLYRDSPAAVIDRFGAALSTAAQPHLVIVGHSTLATNVVLETARRWRGRVAALPTDRLRNAGEPSLGRVLVTLVAPGAPDLVLSMQEAEPALEALVAFRPVDIDASASQVPDLGGVDPVLPGPRDGAEARPRPRPLLALVCLDDEAAALRASIRVRRALDPEVPIVVSTSSRSGVASLLNQPELAPLKNVSAFDLEDEVSWVDFLMRDPTESLARAIHADYRRRMAGKTGPDGPAALPWEQLPSTYKEANRDQAADVTHKLSAVDCRLVPSLSLGSVTFSFLPEEIERLAVMEHERWVSERTRDGWRYGEQKDEATKTHPALVPWEELSEPVKDLDRDTVRALPAFLAEVGYSIVRQEGGAATSSP